MGVSVPYNTSNSSFGVPLPSNSTFAPNNYPNASDISRDPLSWPPEDNSTGTWHVWDNSSYLADPSPVSPVDPSSSGITEDCHYARSHNAMVLNSLSISFAYMC